MKIYTEEQVAKIVYEAVRTAQESALTAIIDVGWNYIPRDEVLTAIVEAISLEQLYGNKEEEQEVKPE